MESLDRGADINATDDALAPPLAYADLERLYLDSGADVDARSRDRTALHFVSDRPDPDAPEMARLLLDRGADIEALDEYGFTPLLWAATAGHPDLVELFLDRGANVLAQEPGGNNVLTVAINSNPEVMSILVQRGVLAAFEPSVAGDLCYSPGVLARVNTQAALLKDHCDATGVVAVRATATPIPDDHGNTFEEATTVAVGEPVEGTLEHWGDTDAFLFEAQADRSYRIDLTLGTLSSSRTTAWTSHRGGIAVIRGEAGFDWNPIASGRYYVTVAGIDGSTGDYTLSIASYTS